MHMQVCTAYWKHRLDGLGKAFQSSVQITKASFMRFLGFAARISTWRLHSRWHTSTDSAFRLMQCGVHARFSLPVWHLHISASRYTIG